ncbi:hypothetical protein AVI56_17460 (plasmid) [Piscirickettsia salmonis]|nr:hypothetical protein AVI56_17460 [Piscirickettsia salmonis]
MAALPHELQDHHHASLLGSVAVAVNPAAGALHIARRDRFPGHTFAVITPVAVTAANSMFGNQRRIVVVVRHLAAASVLDSAGAERGQRAFHVFDAINHGRVRSTTTRWKASRQTNPDSAFILRRREGR